MFKKSCIGFSMHKKYLLPMLVRRRCQADTAKAVSSLFNSGMRNANRVNTFVHPSTPRIRRHYRNESNAGTPTLFVKSKSLSPDFDLGFTGDCPEAVPGMYYITLLCRSKGICIRPCCQAGIHARAPARCCLCNEDSCNEECWKAFAAARYASSR